MLFQRNTRQWGALGFALLVGLLAFLTYNAVTTDRMPWDLTITKWVQVKDPERAGFISDLIFWMGLRGVAGGVLIVVVVWLWTTGRRAATPFFAIIGVLDLLNIPLRDLIDRPRPTPDLVGVVIGYGGVQGDSFPSGHSLHAILFYGYIIYLVKGALKPGPLRNALWIAMGLYIPIAGVWLIYDGRHWFSDVAGGYVYGTFYLVLLIAAYRRYLVWSQGVRATILVRQPSSLPGRTFAWALRSIT